MLFNSLEFALFLPVVVAVYFLTPSRYRWVWLLSASYYFYAAWKAEYLVLIVFSTIVDYWTGLRMGQHASRDKRRPYLALSLCSNLGLLFAFKYFSFFNESIQSLLDTFNIFYDVPAFDVLLPVGISFYTFQTLSYTIDVYRGEKEPEYHLGIFALYVSFFPQLVAGPIERSKRLLPQFHQSYSFKWRRVVRGLQYMLWGFFLKIVVADRLAQYVNEVYNHPEEYTGIPVWVATYFFSFQIYGDFAGYSLIAIGTALIMGFDLMENFRRPYFSKSIGEFWRRWHISLSTWFKDYLYIPLGGNRVDRWRWYYNLIVVFLISGLWHGAAWTFVVWGALHGAYLVGGIMTREMREQVWAKMEDTLEYLPIQPSNVRIAGWSLSISLSTLRRVVAVFLTFHLVLLAWVFFRANSLSESITILQGMFTFSAAGSLIPELQGFGAFELLVATCGLAVMGVVHWIERSQSLWALLDTKPRWVRWGVYQTLILMILILGVYEQEQFIYFQF